jgi:cysteinyl-tRNA synthetase
MLRIYNTKTRQKEPFLPLKDNKVKMYCCGVTVYDYCHLGHARSYIVWDFIRRYLRWRGYQVTYVQNFTDIDDKILKRAQEEGVSMAEISEKYIKTYYEDMRRLNIKDADEYPQVTEHISEICQFIRELEQKSYTYTVNGDVYYKVQQFSEYGKLSGRNLEQMQAGASGRLNELDNSKKKESFDFVLWKAAKSGEPAWESPWGKGRPGWHIECSAMIRSRLGDTIDIHGGGGDLVFPHHENEIAQSEVLTGQPLARYWLHNGMVRVNGAKMSKSLGNFTTIRALLDRPLDPMVLRLFVLQAHYRKPLDFTEQAIASAKNSWNTLKKALLWGYQQNLAIFEVNEILEPYLTDFRQAMDDDFNTSKALAILFELAKDINREGDKITEKWQTLVNLAQILGLEAELNPETTTLTEAEIQELIAQRKAARLAKNYAEGDRLRLQLQQAGITLIDLPNGEMMIIPPR